MQSRVATLRLAAVRIPLGVRPRRGDPRRRRALRAGCAVGAALTVVAAAAGVAVATSGAPSPGSTSQVRSLVAASHKINVLPGNLTPTLTNASSDDPEMIYPNTKEGCASVTQCVFGDATGTKTLVLFGDSHAEMWLSSIIPYAVSHQLKIVLLTTLGCPVAAVNVWLSAAQGYYTACTTSRARDVSLIVGLHPSAIVVSERTAHLKSSPTAYFTNAQWQAGLEKTLSQLKPSKATLIVIGDITVLDTPPPQCLAAYPSKVQKCANASPNPRSVDQSHSNAQKAAAAKEGARFINPVPWLCARTCSPVIGNMVAYWDGYHMSNTYATYLSKVMAGALGADLK